MGEHGQRSMMVASCSPHYFSHQDDGEPQKEMVSREGRGDAGHFMGEDCSLAVVAYDAIHGDTARPPPSLILNGYSRIPPHLSLLPSFPSPSLRHSLLVLFCLPVGMGDRVQRCFLAPLCPHGPPSTCGQWLAPSHWVSAQCPLPCCPQTRSQRSLGQLPSALCR